MISLVETFPQHQEQEEEKNQHRRCLHRQEEQPTSAAASPRKAKVQNSRYKKKITKAMSLLESSMGSDNNSNGLLTAQDRVPLEVLCDHISPFLDRSTFNNFARVNKQTHRLLRRHTPPWPRKLASVDHCCRIRCLAFSTDGTQLAAGCTDGLVRSWNVKTGERPPLRGHMPGQSVLAVSFSNCNGSSYVASSSTDHTIRIFDMQQEQERIRLREQARERKRQCRQQQQQQQHHIRPGRNYDVEEEVSGGDNNDDDAWSIGNISSNTNNSEENIEGDHDYLDDDGDDETSVSICISAGHAYCLSFSPDDTYLVSGHHLSEPRRGAGPAARAAAARFIPSETISIWDAATGLLLRAIRGGGMPVSFMDSSSAMPLSSSASSPSLSSLSSWSPQPKSIRIVSTSSDDCLKMWSLNHINQDSVVNNNNDDERMLVRVRERERSPESNSRCVRRWFLGSYNTVMPCPTDADAENIMVASIDEKDHDSFSVWNTSDPKNRRSFKNISPYEIRISSNGKKVASVDDFSKVKVWRISDGKLLSTFGGFGLGSGGGSDTCNKHSMLSSRSQKDSLNYGCINIDEDLDATSVTTGGWFSRSSSSSSLDEDRDDSSITSRPDDFSPVHESSSCMSGGIHEIAFSKDSTVAVISRHYNEIYLFDT